MKTSSAITLLAMATVVSSGHAQVPTLKEVVISCKVWVVGDTFVYTYSVRNGSASTGSASTVSIDIAQPAGGAVLDGSGLVSGPGFLRASSQAILSQASSVAMVPVGIESPINWGGAVSVSGTATWGAINEVGLLLPGQFHSGFQLTSPGLPSLREVTVRADLDVNTLPIAAPTDTADLARYKSELDAIVAQAMVRSKTIGPSAPPAILNPASFVKLIQEYGTASLQHGWIPKSGILISLNQKLDAALAALGRGDRATAANILHAFIKELDAQTANGITAEAMALLKYNAQYLMGKLM